MIIIIYYNVSSGIYNDVIMLKRHVTAVGITVLVHYMCKNSAGTLPALRHQCRRWILHYETMPGSARNCNTDN